MKSLPLLLILAPAGVLAASPFDGTWTLRPGSFRGSGKPFVAVLDQNEYRCDSCAPPWSVKPDGQFHQVIGHSYDSIATRIVDPHTIEYIERKDGKELAKLTMVASQDGEQLRLEEIYEGGEKPYTEHIAFKRTAGTKADASKHAVSGSWEITGLREATKLPTTLKMTDDGFSLEWNGQHYEAKLDGQPVAIEGDPAHTMVSVKRLSATEVQETDTLNGVVVDEIRYAVSPDGKSIKVVEVDPRSGMGSRYVLDPRR